MDNPGMEKGGQGQLSPVVVQPGQPGTPMANAASWVPRPDVPLGCPPGLEYLTQIDQIIIKQQIELLEVFTSWEACNRFKLLNSVGQQVYFAHEESDLCMRQCCGPARGFVMHITDNAGVEVMRVSREFKCCAGCCWCANSDGCAFEVSVEAPVGTVIGSVRQEYSKWKPHLSVSNRTHGKVGIIRGPCCPFICPCAPNDVVFAIMNAPNEDMEIGSINKKWTGCGVEYFTDADTFSVSFPMDMDVNTKAVFIAATFLVDYMFFEKKQN